MLVDNVFAHTAEPAGFRVVLDHEGSEAHLVVEDDGGGLSGEAAGRPGTTGLGLDIARRTAESCGGRLTLGRGAGGGTRVEVVIPVLEV